MHQWPIFCKHRHDFPIISITCIQNYTPLFLPKQKKKIWYSVDISLFQVHDYNTKSSIIFNCNPKTIFAGYLKKEKINKNEAIFNSWSHEREHSRMKTSFSYRHQDLPRGSPQQPWKVLQPFLFQLWFALPWSRGHLWCGTRWCSSRWILHQVMPLAWSHMRFSQLCQSKHHLQSSCSYMWSLHGQSHQSCASHSWIDYLRKLYKNMLLLLSYDAMKAKNIQVLCCR